MQVQKILNCIDCDEEAKVFKLEIYDSECVYFVKFILQRFKFNFLDIYK